MAYSITSLLECPKKIEVGNGPNSMSYNFDKFNAENANPNNSIIHNNSGNAKPEEISLDYISKCL